MEYIKVHIFTTKNEANQAVELINKGEGIPISDDAATRTYCEPFQIGDFWYIHSDEVTNKYLSLSQEIKIETELK